MKAVAVCPDGKELRVLTSGRRSLMASFMVLTMMPIVAYDMASMMVRSLNEWRPRTPARLSP